MAMEFRLLTAPLLEAHTIRLDIRMDALTLTRGVIRMGPIDSRNQRNAPSAHMTKNWK